MSAIWQDLKYSLRLGVARRCRPPPYLPARRATRIDAVSALRTD